MNGNNLREWFGSLSSRDEQSHSLSVKQARKPLPDQIDLWLRTTPQAVLSRPWRMREIQQQFIGKYRSHPHPQNLAAELRRRGWTTRRLWTMVGEGQRIWYPPTYLL